MAGSVSDPLSPELADALNAWVDAARAVAGAIAGNSGPDEFNAAIRQLERREDGRAGAVRRRILTKPCRQASAVTAACDDRAQS